MISEPLEKIQSPPDPTPPQPIDGAVQPVAPERRSLESLANEIRVDAAQDAIFYLIRSNTSYDGE